MAWIKNEGVQPVADDVMVRVRFNNGQIYQPVFNSNMCWLTGDKKKYPNLIAEYEIVDTQRQDRKANDQSNG